MKTKLIAPSVLSADFGNLQRDIETVSYTHLDVYKRQNLRFVVSVSKQYQNQGLSLPDLILSLIHI